MNRGDLTLGERLDRIEKKLDHLQGDMNKMHGIKATVAFVGSLFGALSAFIVSLVRP